MTAQICIIDGPRSAGKTTIVQAVYNYFNELKGFDRQWDVRIHKTPRPDGNLWFGINRTLDNWLDEPNSITYLVDRFHLTEYVYSTVLGRVDDYDLANHFVNFDHRLYKYRGNIRYTVLMSSPYQLAKRTLNRPEPEKQHLDMDPEIAWHLWMKAVAISELATLRMNETVQQQEKCIADIIDWIKNPTRRGVEF